MAITSIPQRIFDDQTVNTNDKIQRFGGVMTAFRAILARRINIERYEDYENAFAQMQSDCKLRFGFKPLNNSPPPLPNSTRPCTGRGLRTC